MKWNLTSKDLKLLPLKKLKFVFRALNAVKFSMCEGLWSNLDEMTEIEEVK